MAVVAPKCNLLTFVSDYLIRRKYDLSMVNIDSAYLKQDFLKRNITCENADVSCIVKDSDCNNRIVNVVPDTCLCSDFVNAYVLKEGVTYFLIVNFNIVTNITCPIVLGLKTRFTTGTVTINSMSDFSYSTGTIRTKKILIGGYPEIQLTILKQNGTICESEFDVNICNAPTSYITEIKKDGDTYLLYTKYNDCGNDCHTWIWDYVQISPAVGLPDSGTINDTVDCNTLPFDSVTTIEPKGSLTAGTIIEYKLTGTNCCNETIIKNVTFEVPEEDGIFLYRSPWLEQGSVSFLPYTYLSWSISNGTSTVIFPSIVSYSIVDEDNLIVTLNSSLTTAGLTGNITRDFSGNFYYNPGVGESVTITTIKILYKYYSVRYNALSNGNTTTLMLCLSPTQGNMIVDWGDGNVQVYTPIGSTFAVTHSYTSVSAYVTANYFHDDDFKLLRLDAGFTTPPVCQVVNFQGTLPSKLNTFSLGNAPQLGIFTGYTLNLDFSVFKDNITLINIVDTNLTSFSNTMFNNNFPLLSWITIRNNKLPVSEIDKVLNQFVSSTPSITTGGLFSSINQIPAAPPSPISAVSRNLLSVTNGWIITTD